MGSFLHASALKRMSWKGQTIEKRVEKKVAKSTDGGEEGDGDEGAGPAQGLRAQNFIKIH